ncbi:MAG: trigger factor, partial [Clostridia bacterium]|nr:trigger factor [Clostridia bacterium]
VFHIVLHGVQEKELSELDDEFAKDVSEFDTFEAYKNDIREKLEKQAAQHTDDLFTNAVVDKVSHNATIEIPAPMIEREIDNMVRDMEMRMMYQGIRMEDYFKFTGMTEETLRGQYRETAELRVRGELVLEAIRKAEGIEADQADVDALVAKYAEQSGIEAEKFTERFTDSDWDYIKTDAATQKTIDFLKANAVAVEPKAEEVKEEEKAE